jgi:hypothetical protein
MRADVLSKRPVEEVCEILSWIYDPKECSIAGDAGWTARA